MSENRSNLLVYAVGIAAVFALVLGIVCLTKLNATSKKLGDVSLADLALRVETIDQTVKTAANEARTANSTNNPAIRNLTAAMTREWTAELQSIRDTLTRVEASAKEASDKVANVGGRSPSVVPAPVGDAGGATQGQLADDGTYVIKSGDTLGAIGRQFGVPWQEIARANPGVDANRLRPGTRIVIPKRP